MIAVTCPTGRIAGLLVPRLCRRGHPVRVLCRAPSRAEHLTALGVQVLKGSLFEPERLALFLRDAVASFIALPLLDDGRAEHKLGRMLAEAHPGSTVEHLVYLSVLGATAETGAGAAGAGAGGPSTVAVKAEVEQAFADTGLDFTFLRPAFLMENLTFLMAEIEGGTLALPTPPEDPFPMVAAMDVACAALITLARGPAGAERIDLVAPEILTPSEIAAVLAEALGHDVHAIEISEREYGRRLERAGMPAHRATHVAELASHLARRGGRIHPAATDNAALGAPAVTNTSFAAFAHELAGGRLAPTPTRAYLTF